MGQIEKLNLKDTYLETHPKLFEQEKEGKWKRISEFPRKMHFSSERVWVYKESVCTLNRL